jgi:ATP-binding cassette subfamily B (MDR/TAP) protein 1
MQNTKPVSTPFATHFKLSKMQCPTTTREKEMSLIPYFSAIGSLMYAIINTRLDIAHVIDVVSGYLSNLGKPHWDVVKWILRYLRGTSTLYLCFGNSKSILQGFADVDMVGGLDDRRSTSGFLFTFERGAISWQSTLQKYVALSTTEAKYIAATETSKEMVWSKRFLLELGLNQLSYMLFCDRQSAMDLSKNSMYHSRTKHIAVRYYWLRLAVEK